MAENNKKAFTIIEMLVAIAIIAVLAVLVAVSLQQTRKSSRDAKRLADIKQIQLALESFYDSWGEYPNEVISGGQIASSGIVYMGQVPYAPNLSDGDCIDGNYTYYPVNNGNDNYSYQISFCLGGNIEDLSFGKKCASPEGIVSEDCFVCETDDLIYHAKNYETIRIGNQCWMAENLNIGEKIAGTQEQENDSIIEKYCYNDDDALCDLEGGLYQWAESLALPYSCGSSSTSYVNDVYTLQCSEGDYLIESKHQGICPDGWYIPNDKDWHILESYLSDLGKTCDADRLTWACWPTGFKIKAGGESGFNAPVSGYRSAFGDFDYRALFFGYFSADSNISNSSQAFVRSVNNSSGFIHRGNTFNRRNAFPVRCVKK